jgi:hypothetical protein
MKTPKARGSHEPGENRRNSQVVSAFAQCFDRLALGSREMPAVACPSAEGKLWRGLAVARAFERAEAGRLAVDVIQS